ncbi:YCF48-related protein [Aliifodinibius sp. S!AR15-10]|nr:YCF48-related protein [Aliifodinibius sp. S!AR15-10]MDR8392958.1 YCF48-related protein [Aliifodinibius sp. S!AR15-10]
MPEVSFRGIAAVDESTCWVSGSAGTILRTTDGGESWQHLMVPGSDSLDFRDVEVFGPDTAIAMSIGTGSESRLYRTTDGGQNWEMVHQNRYEQGFYDAIAFWDNGFGVLQGDPIDGQLFILVTEDSGRTWQEIPRKQMPEVEDGEYAFAASGTQLTIRDGGHAWIGTGGVDARVLRSEDYGQNWSSTPTPIIQGEASTGIFSLAFADKSFGIAVGGDYTKEDEGTRNVIYSENGGASWDLLHGIDLDFRSAVRFTDGIFITVGPSGSEYTTDWGQTWQAIQGPGFHTLSIGQGGINAVWAAGRDGRVGKLVVE